MSIDFVEVKVKVEGMMRKVAVFGSGKMIGVGARSVKEAEKAETRRKTCL